MTECPLFPLCIFPSPSSAAWTWLCVLAWLFCLCPTSASPQEPVVYTKQLNTQDFTQVKYTRYHIISEELGLAGSVFLVLVSHQYKTILIPGSYQKDVFYYTP